MKVLLDLPAHLHAQVLPMDETSSHLPGTHRFRDTFMLAHNAHLLLGTCGEDEAGNKLL